MFNKLVRISMEVCMLKNTWKCQWIQILLLEINHLNGKNCIGEIIKWSMLRS
jgi:hypothetical protein